MKREELLQALVAPSLRIAPGYGVVSLSLNDGTKVSGVLKEETNAYVLLENGEEKTKVSKSDIKSRESLPSSMPGVGNILTKREIRDLVEFLTTLKPENS